MNFQYIFPLTPLKYFSINAMFPANMKIDTPFRHWRAKMEFTQAQAALAIGRSEHQIVNYDKVSERGDLPRVIRLAMLAYEQDPEEAANV